MIKKNVRWFLVYFSLYVTLNAISVKFDYLSFCTEWLLDRKAHFGDMKVIWMGFAISLNVYIFKDLTLLISNKYYSAITIFIVSIIIGILWFWVSVIPGGIIYLSLGGPI